MTELDPELKERIRDFIHNKGWAKQTLITERFVPGPPDGARRYLDQLTADSELRVIVKANGQTTWFPAVDLGPSVGATVRVKWGRYTDGRQHAFSEEEIQREYGITPARFRRRLAVHCRRKGWKYKSLSSLGMLYIRIEKPRR